MNSNSIIVKHGIYVVLFAFLFIVGVITVNSYIVNGNIKKSEIEKIENTINTILPTVAINLSFEFEKPIEEQLSSLLLINQHILAIEVESSKKAFSYQALREDNLKSIFEKKLEDTFYYTRDIIDPTVGDKMGTISIAYSNEHYLEILFEYMLIQLAIVSLSIITIFFFLRMLYKRLKPLEKLSRKLNRFNPSKTENIMIEKIKGSDEVAVINNAVKSMVEKIDEYYNTLSELNRDLLKRVEEEVEKNREKDRMMVSQARFAAMGEMMGNIAHQWRQPLNVIALEKDMLVELYYHGELNDKEIEDFQTKTNNKLQYMSKTIDNFRNFFRPNKEMAAFCLKESVEGSLNIIFAELTNNEVLVKKDFDEGEHWVYGYENEFKQVVINILNNAKDAIVAKEVEEGEITIKLFRDGENEIVEFIDNGGGIDEEIKEKIFDPYFTTKFKSQGTGLGLYMSKMIVNNTMNGEIIVKSRDKGTIFRVEIPIHKK